MFENIPLIDREAKAIKTPAFSTSCDGLKLGSIDSNNPMLAANRSIVLVAAIPKDA